MEISVRTWAPHRFGTDDESSAELARLSEQLEELEAELAREVPDIGLDRRWLSADAGHVVRVLPADSMLLEFVKVKPQLLSTSSKAEEAAYYTVFIVAADRPGDIAWIDLGPSSLIDSRLDVWLSAIVVGDSHESREVDNKKSAKARADEAGRNLSSLLLTPLWPRLEEGRHLLISPDAELSRLPFGALPVDDSRSLIDCFGVSYLATGRDVLRLSEREGSPQASLVLADPDFDLGKRESTPRVSSSRALNTLLPFRFRPLPGTRLEGMSVARKIGAELWLREKALKRSLKERCSPFVLHIATHGFFVHPPEPAPSKTIGRSVLFDRAASSFSSDGVAFSNPLLRAGLALAGANGASGGFEPPPHAEDGVLTALDAAGLDLSGTELVVLSACETGLGEMQRGEGVLGLRRAFIVAGASTLVMSLWKVPDLPTALLMDVFYSYLWSGYPRHRALSLAQKELREMSVEDVRRIVADLGEIDSELAYRELAHILRRPDDDRPFDSIYYWGAFVCQGEPGPLPSLQEIGPKPP